MRRLARILAWGTLALVLLVISGLLLADYLVPRATGLPGKTLSTQDAQTPLDRQISPLLASHPGETAATLLPDGLDAFAARAASARMAGRSLDLQYYIWHGDLVGRLLASEVHAAARRGVRVRILLDDINTRGLDPALLALDADPNIEIRVYNPFRNRKGLWRAIEMVQRFFSVNHRMHNKAWIADDRLAIVGGRNIGDEYFDANPDVNFSDLDMALMGPAVSEASAIFDQFWNSSAAVPIRAIDPQEPKRLDELITGTRREAHENKARAYLDHVAASPSVQRLADPDLGWHWSNSIHVVSDPPVKTAATSRDQHLLPKLVALIDSARHQALLISPYLVPGKKGTAALVGLAHHGVHVVVITNSLAANDVPAVHSGYARYRGRLLDGGVSIFETRSTGPTTQHGIFGSSGASLHTKAMLVDDSRGFVGSYNFDPRSANLNTEMGVMFDDAAIGAELRREFQDLESPQMSYLVRYGPDGSLEWVDRSVQPPRIIDHEPDTGWWRRFLVRVLGWLPIESQL